MSDWSVTIPFLNLILLVIWALLLYLDLRLFRRRLNRIPNGRNEAESAQIIHWIETSREMKIRRKVMGNVYWDGYNWLLGKKV